jgi:hypothetical protein
LPAVCRTAGGLRDECHIADISAKGCCIATRKLFVRVGARVAIRPEGIEGLTGIVRWISGNLVGIEFDTPLYEPVVDHLGRLYAAGATVPVSRSAAAVR